MRTMLLLAMAAGLISAQATTDRTVEAGRQMLRNIEARERLLADPVVNGYMQRVASRFSKMPVVVFESAEPVTSAVPGGPLLISAGALLQAGTEAEVGALLAHALGHAHQAVTPEPAEPGGLPLVFMGGPWGLCMRSDSGNARVLLPVAFVPRAEAAETAADEVALASLVDAGYDPEALIEVFERWSTTSKPSHLMHDKARQLSTTKEAIISTTSEFEAIQDRLRHALPVRTLPSLYQSR